MIDLSFLTEEEQEAIMKVLQRDAELKRAEEERVRHLPEKIKDDVQLKNMSGQWFYEAKSKRHRDKIHGADIIRASMRRKPATIAEMSQNKSNKARNSWVSNVNKEVFVQPKLYDVVEHQEEEVKSSSSSKITASVLDKPQEQSGKAAVSPVKQRRNPFNSTSSGENPNSGESENGPVSLLQLSKKEILSSSKENQPKANLLNNETEKPKKSYVEPTNQSQRSPVKPPVPKARKLIQKATDPMSQKEHVPEPAKRTGRINGTPARGILKRSSSSSSTDSEVLRVNQMFDAQTKSGLPTSTIFEGEAEKSPPMEVEDSSQASLERLKQVRFSSSIGKGEPPHSPQVHHGREIGEFDLLETDEMKSNENGVIQTDSLEKKRISAVKPLGTYSSALQVNEIDGLQEDTSASNNRSVFLASETLQTKIVPSKKTETPEKPSSTVLPNSNKERIVDEMPENKSKQLLSNEPKALESHPDRHLFSAKTEAREVSNSNSAGLQQGKPEPVEEQDAKNTCRLHNHAAELVEASDEPVSKILNWFKRSSGAGDDRKPKPARLQGRESKEDMDFSSRKAVLTTDHSGPYMDGKTQVKEESLFGRTEKMESVSHLWRRDTALLQREDTQLIREKGKPKQGEKNDKESLKSHTEFACRKAEEKESDQEIMQQSKKANLLEHQENKQPPQTCESEKAIREKRRLKEIREFWEKTIPSPKQKEAGISVNASDSSMLKGLKESDRIKPTAVNLTSGLDNQSNNMLQRTELSNKSQSSRNEHQKSFEFKAGHAVEKLETVLPSDGEVHGCPKPPNPNNLQPRASVNSSSPKCQYKDEKEMIQGKDVSCSQEKPNFKVSSLKEKMDENFKNQISNPSQFQSLRNFWNTEVKLQSQIDEGDVSLPSHASSIIYQRESKEDKKGRANMSKQDLNQQQMQDSEREKIEKINPAVCKLPLESPTLKGLNVTKPKITYLEKTNKEVTLVWPFGKKGKPVDYQNREQFDKQCDDMNETAKITIQTNHENNEHKDGFQKLHRETSENQSRRVGMIICDKMNPVSQTSSNVESTLQQDIAHCKEVNETIERSVAPSKPSGLSSALENLLKESPNTSLYKPKSSDHAVARAAELPVESVTYQCDAASPQEVSETVERLIVPSKPSELSSALEKLLKEASQSSPCEPKSSGHAVARATELPVESVTYQSDAASPQEVSETVERLIVPSKPSELSSALEKLLKEASQTSPCKPKSSDHEVARAAEVPVGCVTCQCDAESPQEVTENTERLIIPSKPSGLSSALEKLLKEASQSSPHEPKHPDYAVARAAEVPVGCVTYQSDTVSPQEVTESIERSVVPSKPSEFSSALQKLLKEASQTSPCKPKSSDHEVARAAEVPLERVTCQCDAESPQEVTENTERLIVPSKPSGLSSALEKLLKEASQTSPHKPKSSDHEVSRAAEMSVESVIYPQIDADDAESLQEVSETIERSVAPSKAEYDIFNIDLQKLLKEASEMPAPILKDMDKEIQDEKQMRHSTCSPDQHERDHPEEIKEIIKTTFASNRAKFEVSNSLEKLLREASEYSSPVSKELHGKEKFPSPVTPSKKISLSMTVPQYYHNAPSNYHTEMKIGIRRESLEQSAKSSVVDPVVNEVESSHLPKRNVTFYKREQRNMTPRDVPASERETKTITIKSFKMDENLKTGGSTSLIASENNFEIPLKFRRTSTPLKDENNSSQPEAMQLCLTSHHDNEEEGDSSALGSEFSDENSDSQSGTTTSTRSEELNPVLMALKRSADRKVPSKSLEDIPSATSNEGKINIPKEELALSAEDVSTVPPEPNKLFSHPEKLRGLSKSVPSFLQDESDDRETDTASEGSYSFGRIKKSPSSLTNLSSSSGMASLSSVSGSLMSIYSGDFGNVDVKGNIQFAIDYVEQLKELHIFICQCKDLAVADVKQQRSDPYVKTYLLPEKYKLGKRKTSVKKKTFNPVYNEILRYKIEKSLLKNQRLNISVWHNDTFGRNSFLGEVELDLGTWDWNDKINKQINWFPLKPRASTMALELENRGQMKIALQYVPRPIGGKKIPTTGEVHIWVKECHDLPLQRGNRLNSFIKCTILPDTSRKSRQKTRTVAKTTNPVFNHTMVYDGFRPEDLKEACIELTVWDHHKLANHFLGGLRIGLGTGKSYGTAVDWMDSTSAETALWEKMMNSPNTWVEDTLPLRMLMVAKLTK